MNYNMQQLAITVVQPENTYLEDVCCPVCSSLDISESSSGRTFECSACECTWTYSTRGVRGGLL